MKFKWTITYDDYEQVKKELRGRINNLLKFYADTKDMKNYEAALERAYGIEDAISALIMAAKFEPIYDAEEVQK